MKVKFFYDFTIDFLTDISEHSFVLIAKPQVSHRQELSYFEYNINGYKNFSEIYDSFGNSRIVGYIPQPHSKFEVSTFGELNINSNYIYYDECYNIYLASSMYIPFSSNVISLHNRLDRFGTQIETIDYLKSYIFDNFEYKKGVTTPYCDIDKFLNTNGGVCQDFSHIMIALLRLSNIPSRYVNGYISGDGETHAWVEAYIDNKWIGIDPTHNIILSDENYIKVAHGRDFFDCRINRGRFVGNTFGQTISVKVKVIDT
jgi:transglutaminase-like putative cysteine protease